MIQKRQVFKQAKFALGSNKNIYWILGGLPKDKDKLRLKNKRKYS